MYKKNCKYIKYQIALLIGAHQPKLIMNVKFGMGVHVHQHILIETTGALWKTMAVAYARNLITQQ